MAWAFSNAGTADQHNTSSGGIQGGQPTGVVANDFLVIHAGFRNNAFAPAGTPFPPTGWGLLTPQVNDTYNYLLGRVADGTAADNFPLLTWSGNGQAFGQMARFTGGPTSITNIIHASVDEQGAGAGALGNDIQYSALTVTQANTLIIARGIHNKTATSNGATLNALTGFTQINQVNPNGVIFSLYWGYQIQTTATSFAAVVQTRNGTVESLQQSSALVSLKPPVTAVAGPKFMIDQQCTLG